VARDRQEDTMEKVRILVEILLGHIRRCVEDRNLVYEHKGGKLVESINDLVDERQANPEPLNLLMFGGLNGKKEQDRATLLLSLVELIDEYAGIQVVKKSSVWEGREP
jgi:hypothetical protein